MRVLNLHGFKGNYKNTNYTLLSEISQVDTISLQLYYEYQNPVDIINQLLPIARLCDILVGTSFGGFFAKRIGNLLNKPCVLTNPCFRPDITLQEIAPEYFDDSTRLDLIIQWITEETNYNFNNDIIFLGDADDIIDHEKYTKYLIESAKIYNIKDGKHSLDIESYGQQFKEAVYEKIDCIQ